jgi:hypothetical protein
MPATNQLLVNLILYGPLQGRLERLRTGSRA